MASYIKTKHLNDLKHEMMTCTYCGFCKSVCPVFEGTGWDPGVARGRIILSYGLMNQDIPADPSVVESLYQCTTCKDCQRRCPSNVKVVEVVERARRDLVDHGYMLPAHRKVVDSIMRFGNPYGERKKVSEVFAQSPRKAKTGYFVGCTSAFRNPQTGRATISILKKLGEDFTLLNEMCCGSVMERVGGSEEEVRDIMRRNIESIASQGVEQVVFSCAGCYRMFKEEYPKHVDVPFKVRHISEFLAERDLHLAPLKKTITYHDPCHLGRHSGVYRAPREVIAKIPGAQFKEMSKSAETAGCCGGGGGVRSAYPELSGQIAAKRVKDASFADVLITACPFCVNNLRVGREKSGCTVEVVDLVEVIDPLLT